MVWTLGRPYRPSSPPQCEKQKSGGVLNRAPNSKPRISKVLRPLASQNPPEQRQEPVLEGWRMGSGEKGMSSSLVLPFQVTADSPGPF